MNGGSASALSLSRPAQSFAVDTVIAVKWNFYCFVSRWHKSVLEVRAAASSPRATARPFGQRGLTPPPASNQGPACDRRLDVAQQPIATPDRKVCLFSEHRSTEPTTCASQPQQFV